MIDGNQMRHFLSFYLCLILLLYLHLRVLFDFRQELGLFEFVLLDKKLVRDFERLVLLFQGIVLLD